VAKIYEAFPGGPPVDTGWDVLLGHAMVCRQNESHGMHLAKSNSAKRINVQNVYTPLVLNVTVDTPEELQACIDEIDHGGPGGGTKTTRSGRKWRWVKPKWKKKGRGR
jgi:hypothetical protein